MIKRFQVAFIIISLIFTAVIIPGIAVGQTSFLSGLPTIPDIRYSPTTQSQALLGNISFTDITQHWGRNEISRAAALSLVRGFGANRFSPNRELTAEEALALIIRTLSLEGDAQREGEGQSFAGSSISSWAVGYILVAAREGIINISDRYTKEWNRPVTRVDFGRWIAAATGLEPIYGDRQQEIYRLSDWRDIPVGDRPMVEALIQRDLMKGYGGQFHPNATLTRGQGAAMIDRIKYIFLEKQGLREVKGIVTGFSAPGSPNIWNNQGEYFNINRGNFPIIKNGIPQGGDKLSLGDLVIVTLTGDNQVIYMEVIESSLDDFLKEAISSGLLTLSVLQHIGNSYHNQSNQRVVTMKFQRPGGQEVNVEILEGPGGSNLLYLSMEGQGSIQTSRYTDWKGIVSGDYSRVYQDTNGRVIIAIKDTASTIKVSGTLEDINLRESRITLRDWDDLVTEYSFNPLAKTTQNGRDISPGQLLMGQEIELTIVSGRVEMIEGYMEVEEPGYVKPGSLVKWGMVYSKNTPWFLKTFHGLEPFIISPRTVIIKDGKVVNQFNIRLGDIAYLYFDSLNDTTPSRILILGNTRNLQTLVRGTLGISFPLSREVIMNNVKIFDRGQWLDVGSQIRYRYDNDTKFNFMSQGQFKDYIGKDIYLGIRHGLGGNMATFIFPVDGFESIYFGKITDLQTLSGQMVIDNTTKINLSDMTAIVHSGRFLEQDHLSRNNQVLIIGDRRGGAITAKYISIEDEYPVPYTITKGRIGEITPDRLTLRFFRDILDHDFTIEQTGPKILYLNHQTAIFDGVLTGGRLTYQELIDSRFDRTYENLKYTGYTISTPDGDLLGIKISSLQDIFVTERISTGYVKGTPMTGWVTLRDMKDYNGFNKQWEFNRIQEEIDLTGALIVKDNKVIAPGDIRLHDKLYIIRETNTAVMVIVTSP